MKKGQSLTAYVAPMAGHARFNSSELPWRKKAVTDAVLEYRSRIGVASKYYGTAQVGYMY